VGRVVIRSLHEESQLRLWVRRWLGVGAVSWKELEKGLAQIPPLKKRRTLEEVCMG